MTNPLTALGKWAKAPLALVVAQVRFTPTPDNSFGVLTNLVQQALGATFPTRNDVEQITFAVGSDGTPTITNQATCVATDILSEDNLTCVRVQDGVLTISTSAYANWESFRAQWRSICDTLCTNGPVQATRIGLRYLDFILPSAGRVPEDYVVAGIGRPPEGLPPVQINLSLYEYERPLDGRLRIQYSRGFGPPVLPLDLQGVVPPDPALQARYAGGASAILDMDRFAMFNKPATTEELASEFNVLRQDIAETFRCIITPMALSEWQGNSEGA